MAHRYGIPVQVQHTADGAPESFTWRGITYYVHVVGVWHLRDRWWDHERQSDRIYFRVMTDDFQVFELYRDITSAGLWVLDRVLD